MICVWLFWVFVFEVTFCVVFDLLSCVCVYLILMIVLFVFVICCVVWGLCLSSIGSFVFLCFWFWWFDFTLIVWVYFWIWCVTFAFC